MRCRGVQAAGWEARGDYGMHVRVRPFGSTGRSVPVLGQGTAGIELEDRRAAIDALRRGIDLGMCHIDTAERYGDGRVEPMVGEAIRGRRDQVFLVSKVSGGHASLDGTIAACERSLRRLGTDWIDCYLLHWPGRYPLEETFEAFEMLRGAGRIRCWGISNFAGEHFLEALRIAGRGHIACNQVVYHLGRRDHEHDVLPHCRARGIAMVGYSPFGAGRFPAPNTAGGHVLRDVAEAHRATPRQVALAFLLRRRDVFLIPKAAQAVHVQENAAAADIELGQGEIETIASAFPVVPHRRMR